MERDNRVVGICAVKQQAVERVSNIKLCKAAGNKRAVKLVVKVHKISAYGVRVGVLGFAVEIVKSE
jgi:hypothetical protein